MPVAEVATLNTDLFNESDGSLLLPVDTVGVAEGVSNLSNRLITFAVASTSYNVKLEDLDFADGLVGILRVFLLDQAITINAIAYVDDVQYEGLLTIDYTDASSTQVHMTVESDRVSGRLLFTFEPVL